MTALATRGVTRMGEGATRRVLEVASDPSRFAEDRDVISLVQEADGHSAFRLRVDDDGGYRIVHLRVWRGRGGLGGLADRFRASPGFTAWGQAAKLVEAGIALPRPLAAAERRPGALEWSLYACESPDATITLEQMMHQVAAWGEARQTKFARNLAAQFRALRARKLSLTEVSPAEFLVRGVPDFEFELLVSDPLKAVLGGELPPAQIESRILFGMAPKVVKAFFHAYG